MAKLTLSAYVIKARKKRPGVHAKTRNSNNKQSKYYVKKYRGQQVTHVLYLPFIDIALEIYK